MSSLDRFDSLFNIQTGERRLVVLLFLQYFSTGIASALTQTTAFALFLTRFDSEKLPLAYIAMAVTVSLLTFGYVKVGRRLSFSSQLKVNVGGQLLITVVFAAGLALSDASWLIFALPVLFQIAVVFGNMAFWSLAGRILNIRQGKRLFGFVGAGEWLAIVTMGFLVPVIVPLVGLSNLLWLAALGMGGALLIMTVTLRLYGDLLAEQPSEVPQAAEVAPPKAGLGDLLRNRYVISLFALTFVWWVAFFFLDNIFYGQAEAQFADGDELAGFLGVYLGALGIITLFSNFFVSGRLLGRFGLRTTLLILPVGLVVGAFALVATDLVSGPLILLFAIAVITKVWGVSVGFSVDLSARSVLYQPLPAALRTRVQTVADGVAQPLATGFAGVTLLVISGLLSSSSLALSIGLLVLAAALLGLAVRVGSGYRATLVEALDKRRLASTDLIVSDAASVAILRRGLHDSHVGVVMYSMRVLGEVDPAALAEELPALLLHPEPGIRRYTLDRIGEQQLGSALAAVRQCLADERAPEVIAAAVRSLAALGDVATVRAFADADDPATRAGAIAGLLTNRDPAESGRAAAAEGHRRLNGLLQSASTDERALAADILSETDGDTAREPLSTLLTDPDQHVRRQALRAAGRISEPLLWNAVIAALTDRSTRVAAAAALISGGEHALTEVGATLTHPGTTHNQLLQLVGVCGGIGDPRAVPYLRPFVGSDDTELRSVTLLALARCGYRTTDEEGHSLQEAIRTEAALVAWLSAASMDVAALDTTGLLSASLSAEVAGCQSRVLSLLSFGGDAASLRRAGDNLAHGSGDKYAYALEVIDIYTPNPVKGIVVSIADKLTPAERLDQLNGQFPQQHMEGAARLQELAANHTGRTGAWTQACAAHTAGVSAGVDSPKMLTPLLDSPSELVRETAAWFQPADPSTREGRMLSTIEKVLVLKMATIFAETSDEILADVAAIATVEQVAAGERIFQQGEPGDSMFIIASGHVRVHDEGRELDDLGTGDVFGEMALLDPEPRSASVTAIDETQLLRLDQQGLFELIDERPEVARGLLQVVSRRLRDRMRDLSELRDRQPEQL